MIGGLIALFWPVTLGALLLLLLLYVSRRRALAQALLPVGAVLIAVSAQRAVIKAEVVELADWVFRALLIGGLASFVLGLVGLAVPFSRLRERVTRLFESPRFRCRAAKENELPSVHELAREFFGDSIATLENMRQWYKKNSELFYVVHQSSDRNGGTRTALVGLLEIAPMTKRAVELLENEELSGATLTDQYIVKRNGRPAGVYVAGIGARGFRAKAWTLGKLDERLQTYRGRGIAIYTRPVTQTGLRLVKKYDFVPVRRISDGSELSRIYRLNAGTFTAE